MEPKTVKMFIYVVLLEVLVFTVCWSYFYFAVHASYDSVGVVKNEIVTNFALI